MGEQEVAASIHAQAGITTGGLTVLVWRQFEGGIVSLYEIIPGFLFSIIAIILISLAGSAPSIEICAEFDSLGEDIAV